MSGVTWRTDGKRNRLVAGAMSLFHERGFGATTLAQVADASGVPVGNIYYYFKTKEELAAAVFERRAGEVDTLLKEAGAADDPAARLEHFVRHFQEAANDLAAHGCPYACLAQDLEREGSDLAGDGGRLLRVQEEWIREQFVALSFAPERAGELALDLLASVQGAIALARAYDDPDVIRDRCADLRARLRAMGTDVP